LHRPRLECFQRGRRNVGYEELICEISAMEGNVSGVLAEARGRCEEILTRARKRAAEEREKARAGTKQKIEALREAEIAKARTEGQKLVLKAEKEAEEIRKSTKHVDRAAAKVVEMVSLGGGEL